MYQKARKLRDVIVDPTSFVTLAEDQLEALSLAVNALYLVEEKSNWVLAPIVPDPVCLLEPFSSNIHILLQTRKRQRLSKHIPESKYLSSKYDAEIVHLSDMVYDCTLLRSQIDSIKREPSLLASQGTSFPRHLVDILIDHCSWVQSISYLLRSL